MIEMQTIDKTPLYTHTLSGRRPAMLLVLGVGAFMLVLGKAYYAPWYFIAPIGLVLLMTGWALIANPQTGTRLTKSTLHVFNRRQQRDIAVQEIASMRIIEHMDGGPSALLTLNSGEKVNISAMCMDRSLGEALALLGVDVEGLA